MHFASALLVAVASLGGLVIAAPAPPSRPPAGPNSASTRCYTRLATTQALWNTQTTWNTHYTSCTSTVTVLKTTTSTSTPAPVISIVTAFTTSTVIGDTTTLTATSTSTNTITESTTTTSTIISTTTSTSTSTSTSTIAAPAGFTAIQTSLPGSTCDGNCDSVPDDASASKRGLVSRGAANGAFGAKGKGKGKGKSPWQYAKGVQCYAWQPQCSTKTVSSTATVVVTATPRTMTSTITSTSLVTSIPLANTTITTTLSITSTTTYSTDTISLSTATATASATTSVYAACASNNLADLYNGMGFEAANGDNYDTADFLTANDAYDCCVAAITDPNGLSVAWAYLIGSSSCTVALQNSGGTCSQPSSTFSLSLGDEDYVYGNGLCGEITSAGF